MSTSKRTSRARAGGIVAGLIVAVMLVWQTSNASLTGSTSNDKNAFAAGTVTITDDDSAAALFSATNMVPGDTVENCIEVAYKGSSFQLTPVSLYATVLENTGLAPYLDVVVEEGTGAVFGKCGEFKAESTLFKGNMEEFMKKASDFSTGLQGFTPSPDRPTSSYKVWVHFNDGAGNEVHGLTTAMNFNWEVQSK